jgi:hypothetical protein
MDKTKHSAVNSLSSQLQQLQCRLVRIRIEHRKGGKPLELAQETAT